MRKAYHFFYWKKVSRKQGFAMVITLLVLVIMTIILIGALQNSTLGIFISQNSLDKPMAEASARACEQHMVRKVLNREPGPFELPNNGFLGGIDIRCQSEMPFRVAKNFKVPGYSADRPSLDLRFQTSGDARRNSHIATVTDVTYVPQFRHGF